MDYLELALSILQLEFNHPDFLFFLTNFLFTNLKDVLLDVGLLVQNTELIITIDQLDTHVVTGFTSLLVFVDKVVHFFLK